jgi:hypothetical protein
MKLVIDMALENRPKDRRLTALPMWQNAKTENSDPTRENERKLKEDPRVRLSIIEKFETDPK